VCRDSSCQATLVPINQSGRSHYHSDILANGLAPVTCRRSQRGVTTHALLVNRAAGVVESIQPSSLVYDGRDIATGCRGIHFRDDLTGTERILDATTSCVQVRRHSRAEEDLRLLTEVLAALQAQSITQRYVVVVLRTTG
jgi:hypothetical protein